MPLPSVSVVIPALNEARNIPHVFDQIPTDVYEVVLVDGFSVDDTVEIARQLWPNIRVVEQTRHGKGNALACGFAAATGDIIAVVDADGSADPGEIPRFVAALLDGADLAKGTRFVKGGGSSDITPLRRLGNYALTFFSMHATAELWAREASLVSAEEGDRRAEELVVTAATTKRNHEILIATSNYPKVSELVRSLQYC